jgi:hypothetical protein
MLMVLPVTPVLTVSAVFLANWIATVRGTGVRPLHNAQVIVGSEGSLETIV